MKNKATVEICSIKRKIAHKTAERVLRKVGTHKAHSTQRGGQIFSPKFSPGSRSRQKRRSHIHVQTQKRKPFFPPASHRQLMPTCRGKNPRHKGYKFRSALQVIMRARRQSTLSMFCRRQLILTTSLNPCTTLR